MILPKTIDKCKRRCNDHNQKAPGEEKKLGKEFAVTVR